MTAPAAELAALPPTRALARFVRESRVDDLPERVRHEAGRALLNYIGCAVGASRHPTLERALAALAPFSGPAQASVLGRADRLDALSAAMMNGITSHTFDFDDTHLRTVIHPSGPVASALLALAEWKPASGADFLHAFVLGVEVECRIGNAVYPSHYDIGWHITGTTGGFGAAAAAARLLGLTEQQTGYALGIAATTASGLREMFGSMCKPLHPGWAARSGLIAALLAQQDFTSAPEAIEGKRGFANVLATERDFVAITGGLGESWQLDENTYKPFACGVVLHPIIDGCLELARRHRIAPGDVARIELGVHPLVLELTGKRDPQSGLEGKFSVYHSAAVALCDGDAGVAQYSDARVRDPAVAALAGRVAATIDRTLAEDAARVAIVLSDGRRLEHHVVHAIGSLAHPMSDRELEAKFRGLCAPILGSAAIDALVAGCRGLALLPDAGALARMTMPS